MFFEEQTNQNLNFNTINFNSLQESPSSKYDSIYHFRNGDKQYQLPKINRRNSKKMDEYGNASISLMTEKQNNDFTGMRIQ